MYKHSMQVKLILFFFFIFVVKKYEDDKILVSLKNMEKLFKFISKYTLYIKQIPSEDVLYLVKQTKKIRLFF